uniref:Protein S100 n=1 Tax=Oncorhynchus tshawytscha TaxID=74940 RepID=A0A8C8JWG2_ONCTS
KLDSLSSQTMAQPTPLEASLGAIIMTFDKHAGSGDAKTLNKKELTNLIKAELHNIAGGSPEVGTVCPTHHWGMMTMLDQNTDGSVDFKEYITLIGSLACATVFYSGKCMLPYALYSVLQYTSAPCPSEQ